ncbi:MAG: ATP synthase F0 subunit B [Lachnospiraceae bacterium]|nr:ATP synthase F0 subunit B [Lachnospiraceae bacterium]
MLRLDWNLLFNAINLIILYFLMKRFLFKPVNEILARRQEEADKGMAEANAVKESALETKKHYEVSLQMAEAEKEKIVSQARNEAAGEYLRIVDEAKVKAEGIVEKAGADAQAERSRILQKAQTEVCDMVVTAAAKVSGAKASEENDRRLYDQFISKAQAE